MDDSSALSKLSRAVGWVMLLVGFSVFAIRLQHVGPYYLPRQGNLLSGVLALILGCWLVRAWLGTLAWERFCRGLRSSSDPSCCSSLSMRRLPSSKKSWY